MLTLSWMKLTAQRSSEDTRLRCGFTWVVGAADHMTTMRHASWQVLIGVPRTQWVFPHAFLSQDMVTESFQRVVFPGECN